MDRHIKGIFFVDYVRMIKGRKDVDWTRHLGPGDLELLSQRIEPDAWYPLGAFERMGLAILQEIGGANMEVVYHWGRHYMDGLFEIHDTLIVKGDPMESLMRFHMLRKSFFDFDALELDGLMGTEVNLTILFGMSRVAEEASVNQTLGFFERLLELSGAEGVTHAFVQRSWEGAPSTIIHLTWS
ncbi:MAG: hypothetical protein JRG91_12460 [Deltaproteobacteria bacterium]|nr:hypothetical protein [Deltaproteobacteria bacterium]